MSKVAKQRSGHGVETTEAETTVAWRNVTIQQSTSKITSNQYNLGFSILQNYKIYFNVFITDNPLRNFIASVYLLAVNNYKK